mgnify:CR=1 FL=1
MRLIKMKINFNITKELFYLFKIHHWIKNLIIFLPILVGHSFLIIDLKKYFTYFLILSILSSIIYLFNNLYDNEEDIKNKKLEYSLNLNKKKFYYSLGSVIFLSIISASYILNKSIFLICLSYFILATLYNFYLKKIKYIDVLILSLFHVLRLIYGSIAFNVELSLYFVLFCSAIFLMIGSNKRLIEIDKFYSNRPYKINDKKILRSLQILCSIFSVLVFLLYSIDPYKNQFFIYNELIYLNLLLIILININFLFFSQNNRNQDIIIFIYKNKINFLLVLIFFIIFLGNSVSFYY